MNYAIVNKTTVVPRVFKWVHIRRIIMTFLIKRKIRIICCLAVQVEKESHERMPILLTTPVDKSVNRYLKSTS